MSEGLILAGRYRLVSKLGQGGMGSVWRAEHLTLGTPVAVKLIDGSIAHSEEALARFRREAQAAAELRSAHVVHIMDYGVENETPYIAMELLEGESLSARLTRMGRLSPKETAGILSQVARALTKAHQQRIVHRDLKPENIFIVREGDDELVKVLDFGIAKKLGLSSTSSGVKTNTGAMLGTPYYMSPEQAKGKSEVDHRTDVWSLAIITYECITGARPFESETLASLLVAICTEPLPIPSEVAPVPKGFDAWFARCASRDLSIRFQSASEAVQKLRDICGWVGSGNSLEITATGHSFKKPPAVLQLIETAQPSSITLDGSKKNRLRRLAVASMAILLLGVAGVLVGRMLTKQVSRSTNASASPSHMQPTVSVEGIPSRMSLNSAVSATASATMAVDMPATPALGVTSAPQATGAEKGSAASARAAKGSRASDSSKGGTGPATAPSSGKTDKPNGKDPPPARRDYDKSVGF